MSQTVQQPPSPEAEVRNRLAARLDVADVVYRLGACLDEHRFDDLRALIADDASVQSPGGTATGREAVVAQATRNHQGYDALQHLFTNVLVELDGERARVRANLAAMLVRDGAFDPALGAVYHIGLRRGQGGWQIERIEISPVWRIEPRTASAAEALVTP